MKTSHSLLGQAVVPEPARSQDNVIQPLIDAASPLTLRQHSTSQSSELLRFESPSGVLLTSFDANGNLIGGGITSSGNVILAPAVAGRNTIQPTLDTVESLIVLPHSATQSVRHFRVKDSAGNTLLAVGEPNGNFFGNTFINSNTAGQLALFVQNQVPSDIGAVLQVGSAVSIVGAIHTGSSPLFSWERGPEYSPPDTVAPMAMAVYINDSTGSQVPAAAFEPFLLVNTHGATRGGLRLRVSDITGDSRVVEMATDGAGSSQIAFLGKTLAVSRPAAYTLAGTPTRVFPADPSAAYTGINNLQAGTPYAQVADLNTLRGVVSTLLGVVAQLQTDLGLASGFGLLAP